MDKLEYPALRETVYHSVLPSGLNVYVDVRPGYSRQFALLAVRCGGMDLCFRGEDGSWIDAPAGTAHFLEHKAFDTRNGEALRRMAACGVDPNAYTTPSMTAYYFDSVQDFEENLRCLLSFVCESWFTQENVEKERGIIVQEIRMGEDDPGSEAYQQMLSAMYARHPIRTRIAGSEASVSEIGPDLLAQCHQAFYRPGNMVLCAAGDLNPDRVVEIAREMVPGEPGQPVRGDVNQMEPEKAARREAERVMPVSMPLFEIGFKGTAAPAGGRLRQRLLAGLACDALLGASGPLYSRLYEQGLINGAFESGYEDEPGCAFLAAGGESRDPRRVLDEVLKEAARLGRKGIDPRLWERLKKAAYGSMVRQLNSLENICAELAQSYFDGEEFFRFPECFQSIELQDAQTLIQQWCVADRAVLSVVWPEK